ncbi:MAG TPA: ABC transporter permease [Bacteroidia bacterium]|nr:ABC transporter permease [Bacteroidia bacterium]
MLIRLIAFLGSGFSFFERFVSRRMLVQTDSSGRMSRPISRVAVGGIAVGLAIMILTLAVMNGFQQEIRRKVIGFGSHIQITGFDNNNSFETDSVNRHQPTVDALRSMPGIRHIQVYATKAGIIKSGAQLMGVLLKGIDTDFDWTFFKKNLKEGNLFVLPPRTPQHPDTATEDVLVSKYIADKMELKVGKKFKMFFLRDNRTRPRIFRVAGIYETGLTDGFDDRFVLCDIRQIQQLNDWDSSLVSGFEVLVKDFSDLDTATAEVNNTIDINLYAQSIRELNPQIFSWLDVLDVNALIIITLMIFVSMINMISALIILILDRTNMIGILKAMGARNMSIRKIFFLHAVRLIAFGMLIGNILGLALCWVQWKFQLVSLDQESYYLKTVPIEINWTYFALLNGAVMICCWAALILPSMIVSRITPVKAIRFS